MADKGGRSKGQRILPVVLDALSTEDPSRVYASVPNSNDISEGFHVVTVSEVAKAVHACAWWMSKTIGTSQSFETVAFTGVNDLRYPVFWFAAIKCGYKVLFLSPRNTVTQNVSLLTQTSCRHFFYTMPHEHLVENLRSSLKPSASLETFLVAPFEDWISSAVDPYHYTKTFAEASDDPIIVLHSSGSTGDPKPITNTNGFFAAADRALPEVPGHELGGISLLDYEGGGGYYSPFPGFHIAGITALSFYPVMMRSASVILGLPDRPPSIDMVHSIITQTSPRVLYLPPSIIEALAQIPSALESMKQAESVVFAGGPLALPVGEMLSEHVKLSSSYGSTEMGNIPCLLPKDRKDWAWLIWHPAVKVQMEPSVEDAFELILHRDKDADHFRGISNTILKTQTHFRSWDLFTPHPSKQGMWHFLGRNDDILVLSNGEKWNPVPSEGIISSHSRLMGALIVGNGLFQPAVLLEAKEANEDTRKLKADVWPLIAEANTQAQRFGRVTRSKVAVVPPASFVRAPKGTVVRKLTAQKLQHVIHQLYSSSGNDQSPDRLTFEFTVEDTDQSFLDLVRRSIQNVSSLPTVSEDADIYNHGFDSLETLELSNVIKLHLSARYPREAVSFVDPQFIFANPSVRTLANAIHTSLHPNLSEETTLTKRHRIFHDISNKYINGIHPPEHRIAREMRLPSGRTPHHVILTGSTGSLGQELLLTLSSSPKVKKVTCLDRSMVTARSKAVSLLASANASSRLDKITFLQAEPSRPMLGLSEVALESLRGADIFIHNAWKLDFNHSVTSFEPLLAGTKNILDWALNSGSRRPSVVFVSSVAAASGFSGNVVPECALEEHMPSSGYGQSKLIAERMLLRASERYGLPTVVLRLGQVAGTLRDVGEPGRGRAWNDNEWIPSMIRTSMSMGQLPAQLPVLVDWIPSNVVAQVITEVVLSDMRTQEASTAEFYNIVNPETTRWDLLADSIRALLMDRKKQVSAEGGSISLVPLLDWIQHLRSINEVLVAGSSVHSERTLDVLSKHPALKIMPFFAALLEAETSSRPALRYETGNSERMSSKMCDLKVIDVNQFAIWIQQWDL